MTQYANMMAKVYSKWGGGWRAAAHSQINTHFRPQVGEGSCFERTAPEEFDTVSTISDVAKMRTFSEHLPSHLHVASPRPVHTPAHPRASPPRLCGGGHSGRLATHTLAHPAGPMDQRAQQ